MSNQNHLNSTKGVEEVYINSSVILNEEAQEVTQDSWGCIHDKDFIQLNGVNVKEVQSIEEEYQTNQGDCYCFEVLDRFTLIFKQVDQNQDHQVLITHYHKH